MLKWKTKATTVSVFFSVSFPQSIQNAQEEKREKETGILKGTSKQIGKVFIYFFIFSVIYAALRKWKNNCCSLR